MNHSTFFRSLYTCLSNSRATFRFFFGGITASAPYRFAAATTASLSYALSAMNACASYPSISGSAWVTSAS
jgi:hypothetical protein